MTQNRVQAAHDIITQVLTGHTPIRLDPTSELLLTECASVLCWVLEHDHEQAAEDMSFGPEYERLVAELEGYGMVLYDLGEAKVPQWTPT